MLKNWARRSSLILHLITHNIDIVIRFYCRGCQGDVPVHCPATRRRSGLRGLPQRRGRPCHAQSTTGTVGGATGLRVRQKDHLAVQNNAFLETVATVNRAVGVQGRLEDNQERLVAAG